jgi:hypothetical protein
MIAVPGPESQPEMTVQELRRGTLRMRPGRWLLTCADRQIRAASIMIGFESISVQKGGS